MRLSAFIGIIGRYSSNASLCPTLRTNWSMRATTNEERMLERPDAYSLVSFASRHGISRSKVYGEIRAGRLTARKIGDRTIILAEDGKTWRESLPKVPANLRALARDEPHPRDNF
jgi:hypothetical protein